MSVDLSHYHLPKAGGVATLSHPAHKKVFTGHIGTNGGMFLRDVNNPVHVQEDEELLKRGLLDPKSLMAAYSEQQDPIRVLVHDHRGHIKHVRYSHNLRINYGGNLLLKQLLASDDTSGTNDPPTYYCNQATITYASSAPWTVTPSTSPSWTVNKYTDHFLIPYGQGVYGVVQSNTATAATVDQWTSIAAGTTTNPTTGAVGTTPSANTAFVILPGGAPLLWVALSTDATSPNTTDASLAGEVTTNGLGRKFMTPIVTTAPSGSSTSTNQTAAAKLHAVWTATGTVTSIQKAGAFNCANNSGAGQPANEGTFTLFGTNNGDTITLDWTWTNT